jgi:hypothetical protein
VSNRDDLGGTAGRADSGKGKTIASYVASAPKLRWAEHCEQPAARVRRGGQIVFL